MTDLSADRNARLMGPYLDEVASSVSMPERGLDELLATVATTPQRRRFMPSAPTWRFHARFGATRFALAGVIVALFGGLLLAGGLTKQSQSDALIPGSTPTASTMPPVDSVQTELLPGVELVTEQVSPTVFRVIDDGAGHDSSRIWQVVIDQDDEVWVLKQRPGGGNPRIVHLGHPGTYTTADGIPEYVEDIQIGADGRLYATSKVKTGHWVVLADQGWRPATKEDRQAANGALGMSVGSRVTATDGTTWEVDRYAYHQGPDGRAQYRLEDMGFTWGKKWLKETGHRKIRPGLLAAAPDGRVWSLWGSHRGDTNVTPGLALAEFDGEMWRDITPRQWRYRSTWPFGDDRSGGITWSSMSVEADGTLRVTAWIHDFDVHWPGDGPAPVERVVAAWDGSDWAIESRTSWDLASIPEPFGPFSDFWIADVSPSGTMVLQIGIEGLETLLYVIEPEIDDSLDEDTLMAP